MKTCINNTVSASLLLLVLVGCRTTYSWQPKGPMNLSGPVKQIIVDKNDSKKLYAATENGGVWVIQDYTDDNSRWRPLTDKLENLQTRGFDVSKHDSNTLIMGNGLGNLHISTDRGDTWSKLNTSNFGYIRKIAIDDIDANELSFYVASSTGLYKLEIDTASQNSVNIIETRTTDEVLDFVIDRYNTDVRYYSQRNSGVFKSEDEGRTWSHVLPLPYSSEMIKIAQPARDGSTIVKDRNQHFLLEPTGTYRSIEEPDSVGAGSDISYRNRFGGRSTDWFNAVAIDPDSSDIIFVGMDHLEYSDDGGLSFTRVHYTHEDYHHIIYNNNDVLVANDGGVYLFRKNEGGSFRNNNGKLVRPIPLNRGFNTYQFYRMAVSGNTAVGNADHNGIKFTENLNRGNPVWNGVNGSGYGNNSLENDFIHKDIKESNRSFVAFLDRSLLRLNIPYSSERSNDMTEYHDSTISVRPFTRFVDASSCTKNGIYYQNCNQYYNGLNYAIGTLAQDPREHSNTMLLSAHNSNNKTINEQDEFYIKIAKNGDLDGATVKPIWSISHTNNHVPIVSMAYSPEENGNVYALDESGKLLFNRDPDAANSWSRRGNVPARAEEPMRQLVIDAADTNNLFAISHERIFRSTDGGQSWIVSAFNPTNQNKINTIAQHHSKPKTYFVGTDRGIYYITKNSSSWRLLRENVPNAPVMQLFTEGKYLYAVTFGRGLWRCDLNNPKGGFSLPPGS